MLEYLEDREIGCLDEDAQEKLNKKIKKKHTFYRGNGEYLHFHFRGKGLSADKLSPELYDQMSEGKAYTNTRDFQMKKIHTKRNSNQKNIPMFSVQHFTNIKKTVNSTRWAGRQFNEGYNYSVPWGSSNNVVPQD
jgi:hypothetical protein